MDDDEERKAPSGTKPHMDDEEDSPEAHAKTHARPMMRQAMRHMQKPTHG